MGDPLFEVERDDRSCIVRSRIPVPFEPRGEALDLRTALRAGLDGLHYGREEGLSCVLHGERPPRSDIENLLLYNIDSSGGRSAGASSISFEQAQARDGWAYTYDYRVVAAGAGFRHYADRLVVARVGPVAVADGPRDRLLDRVWLALKERGAVQVLARSQGPLALRLMIGLPEAPRRGIAGLVKGLFDGVVAALAVDSGSSATSIARLAARCGRSSTQVARLLRAGPAPLGAARLLSERGAAGVQWYPSDDHLVAGALALDAAPAARLIVQGDLIAVDAAASCADR